MTDGHQDSTIDDPRFAALFARCLESLEQGEAIDAERLRREHPEYADQLLQSLDDRAERDDSESDVPVEFESDPHGPTVGMSAPADRSENDERIRYFGDYLLLEELARGGMGVVYRARQEGLNRIVAIKMILAGQLASEADVKRFRGEAEAAANLDHRGIVPIFEVGEHEGQHYFSMGYVEGESLADRVKEGPRPPREAAEIVKQVAEAIAYAHEKGVIHRDLKPANVLIDQNGQPKVTDFGLAKSLNQDSGLTNTGQILGTPSYMSPEQASGRTDDVGPLSDIYSLGGVLYCLVTGRPPFQASNPTDTLSQVIEQEPVPPRSLNSTIPKNLATICLKCLEKQPSRRYSSAGELRDDLVRFLNGEPILGRRMNPVIRTLSRSWRRHRAAWVGLSLVLAALLWALGVRQYRLWDRGSVTVRSDNLTIEVTNEQDGKVVTRIAAPTSQPVSLRSGDYFARIDAGRESKPVYRMLVPRGEQLQFTIRATDEPLWESEAGTGWSLINMASERMVLVVGKRRLRLIRAGTGAPVWLIDTSSWKAAEGTTSNRNRDNRWFKNLDLFRLIEPARDVNGDQIEDFVFVSDSVRDDCGLFAVSGRDGSLVWHKAVDRRLKQVAKSVGHFFQPVLEEQIFGPIVADGGSGAPANIVYLRFHHEKKDDAEISTCVVESISGEDGRSIWKSPVEKADREQIPLEEYRRFGRDQRPFQLLQRVELAGERVVVLTAGKRIVGLRESDGAPAWETIELDSLPLRPLRFHNAETGIAVLASLQETAGDRKLPYVVDVSIPDGQQRWQTRVFEDPLAEGSWFYGFSFPDRREPIAWLLDGPASLVSSSEPEAADWPLVVDLNNDDEQEVLLPASSYQSTTVGLLSLQTGQEFWRAELPRDQRFLTGRTAPDLNGDRWRDLFLILERSDGFGPDNDSLFVAISGRDGEVLKQWNIPKPVIDTGSGAQTYRWLFGLDRTDAEGWPLCAVDTSEGVRIFSPATGELIHSWPEHSRMLIRRPIALSDLNKDGETDLLKADSTGQLVALPIEGKELWRRLGDWQSAEDYDGDGVQDLISAPLRSTFVGAVSGVDGDVLWSAPHEATQAIPLQGEAGDLNHDQVPDLLSVLEEVNTGSDSSKPREISVSALSGATGDRLWVTSIGSFHRSGGSFYGKNISAMPLADADGDAVPDVFIGFQTRSSGPDSSRYDSQLVVLSGRHGKLLWSQTVATTDFREAALRPIAADLTGDGRTDLLYSIQTHDGDAAGPHETRNELHAIRGGDGAVLWTDTIGITVFDGLPWARSWDGLNNQRFCVADLDSDGGADIVYAEPEENLIRALDGSSGDEHWVCPIPNGVDRWKYPLICCGDLDQDPEPEFCLRVQTRRPDERRSRFHLQVIDHRGELTHNHADEENSSDRLLDRLRCLDADADGSDEIMVLVADRLRLFDDSFDQLIWEQNLPAPFHGVVDVSPSADAILLSTQFVTTDENGERHVLLRDPGGYLGINARTGRINWRVSSPYAVVQPQLLFQKERNPAYLLNHPRTDQTVVRRAWSVSRGSTIQTRRRGR